MEREQERMCVCIKVSCSVTLVTSKCSAAAQLFSVYLLYLQALVGVMYIFWMNDRKTPLLFPFRIFVCRE